MNTCPNINLPEWKALEKAVGRFEAYRDYMETNGQIRDPKTVIEKIDLRNRYGRADDAGELSKIKEAVANDVDWATTTLEAKTEEFLAGLGFKVEYEKNLYETIGYNIVAATDLIQKTVHLHESLGKQAFTKEAAYALLEMLGRKNILYKELIHNVHLLEDYQTRVAPYTNSDLNDWMQRKLVVVDYLFEQLNKNFESFETIDKKRISKDITAGNKFQYAMLRFKLWIKNLFKKFRVKQNRQKFTDIINQVAQSVLTRNYDLWSVGKRTMKKFDPDVYLQKDPALKDAFTKLRDMGFIPSGSYALAKQGTVYRDSFNDLDFTVPFDQVESGEYLKKLKKVFPNMTIGKIFKGVNKYAVTLPLRLGDVKVDLFLPLSKEYPYSITPEGVQNWESVFDAKIRIGSKKHMADLVNFIPSTSNAVMLQGMRHYNFDFVPSRYSDIYNTGQIFSPHGNVVSLSNADVEFLYPIARDYLQHNKRIDKNGVVVCANGKPSQQFAALMGYHNDEKRAMIDYWKTFSQDFLSWYGMVPDRKNTTSLKFVEKSYDMSTPSIFIDTNGEPIIQYHGAGSVFDKFDKAFFRQGEGAMAYGAGFYGTNFKPTADKYRDTAQTAMKKFQELLNQQDAELLAIMKKLEIDLADMNVRMLTNMMVSGGNGRSGFGDLLSLLGVTETKVLYIKLTNPLEWNDKVRPHIKALVSSKLNIPMDDPMFDETEGNLYHGLQYRVFNGDENKTSEELYKIGIDGTVHYTGGGFATGGFQHQKGERHFVIFEPVQAKAINNKGFFSTLNANMYDAYGALPSNKFVRDEFLTTGKRQFTSTRVSPEKQAKREELIAIGTESLKSSFEATKKREEEYRKRDEQRLLELKKNMRRNEKESQQFVSRLSKALGIKYESVSATEAREMTKNDLDPWTHQPAFFFKGKVYFVGESISNLTAFHEFSHPFVRAIIKENPDLARQLFNELRDTDLGRELIENYIYELAFDSFASTDDFDELREGNFDKVPEGFAEEILVRAITHDAMDYIYGSPGMPQFKNVVDKIMYHIKQFLKKVFGKSVKIDKLDVNTPLGELVNILKEGKKVDISLDLVTDEHVAYYSERSAEEVLSQSEDPSLQDLKNVVEPQVQVINTAAIEQDYALELADKMSRMLGVDYEMISAKEAQELTKDAQNPWNGQFAFFYGGKVYFVKDGFTKAHVFHEFCHPVIRSLAKTDPELFAKLYNEALNTSEGRAIFQLVADRYGLEPNSDLFKEEVIVQMLEQMGMKILDKEVPSPAFKNIIDKIMYEIKQLLRRVFGKNIPVSKITPRTSLKELAEILVKGEKLEIDTELITDEDIVAYRMDEEQQYREIQEDLGNVRNKDIQDTINSLYDQVDQHINMLLRDGHYEELAELLMDENQRGDLQQIKSNLRAWQTRIRETAEDFLKEAADSKNRVNALTNTLFRVEVVMRKIHDHVKDLSTRPETQEVVGQIYYYNKMLDHWKKFITDLKEMLNEEENKVPPRSAVMSLVNDIDSYIDRSKDVLDKMYRKAGVDTLWDTLTPIAGNLQDDFDAMIAKLDKLKAPQREYDRRYKDYYGMVKTEWDRYRVLLKKEKANTLTRAEEEEIKILHAKAREGLYIDKAKIEATVKGQMGDANFFSSYLEGYLYNPDPIVGGLALFIKNAMSDVMIVTQRKYNVFAADMENLLKDYGGFANSLREGWLGERTLFKDTIGVLKDGRYVPMEVLTFLNGYKGHRWAKAEQNQTLEDAYAAWDENRTDATRAAYLEALEKHREFMSDYFYQEYDDRYYEKDKVFKKFNGDQIGRDAYEARTEIFEKMRLLLEGNKTQMDELETSKQMELYWREYRQLFSRYNLDGSLKKDNAAAIAERLREYREKSKELYENRIRKGVFENAYFDFLQELRDKNIQEHSSEWDYEVERWKKNNLRAAIKPEFFEYRNSRIAKIEAVLKKLDPSIRKDNDTAAIWTKILELTTVRDNDNQTIGTELSEGSIAEVKKLQEQLAKLKADTTPLTNLTKTENARMRELNNQRWTVGITTAELEELKALQAKRAQGLSDVDIALLSGYYQELASMQIKQATVYYVDTLNDWLSRLDTSNIKRLLGGDGLVDQDTADMLADDLSALNDLFSQSPDFEKWWKDNHMLSKKKVEVSEGQWVEVNYYERVYVWNVIRPKNPDMMETHTIKDSYGNEIVFEGLPTMKYYARVVKPKYKTPRIVGVTVDNQGNFLPKSKEDMDKATHLSEGDRYKFIDMEYHRLKNSNAVEDKKLFAILEKLKQHHLANQEGLPRSSKLYYDAPRFMKSNLEAAQSFSLKRKDKDGKQVNMLTYLMQRIREFWHGNAEDKYQGLRNMEAGLNIIRVDMFDNELTNVPIAGIYSMDVDAVARNITMSMMRYMQSAERQKQLIKISPIARAIQASIANPEEAVNTLKTIDARNRKTRKIVKMVTKGDSVRKKAVDNLIAREFAGETQAGFTKNMTTLNKVANLLFKRASFSFFAINIPSALKNSLGMKFQEMIEASGGEYVDHISLQRGNLWAGKVVGELTFTGEAYTRGMKNHDVQLTEAFDMAQDRFAEVGRFGGQMSRTLLRDIAEGQHWFGFRKMVEYQATLQLSGGMLYKKRLKRVMPDGTVQELPYIEAFETVDGLLRLKDGIDVRYGLAPIKHIVSGTDTVESIMKQYHIQLSEDPERQKDEQEAIFRSVDLESIRAKVEELEYMRDDELETTQQQIDTAKDPEDVVRLKDRYNAISDRYAKKIAEAGTITIDNTEFNLMKNRMHQVTNNMGGAYAKFDQPEAQRYLAFRFIAYMRRYFTGMAIARWGASGQIWRPRARRNFGIGGSHMGFYTDAIATTVQAIRTAGNSLKYLSPREKANVKRFITEFLMLKLTVLLMAWLFGWDPEDEDRYEKLRARSGPALQGLGVTKGEEDFDLLGFGELHALHMLMQVRAENEQFNPIMGGFDDYFKLVDLKSVVFGPTTDSFLTLVTDSKQWVTGDPKAYYTRDMGPYTWQEKGDLKFYNHLLKMVGLTGRTVDPAMAIQNLQNFMAKVRR